MEINECNNGSNSCAENASFENNAGSYTCEFSNGYNGDGFECINIDECAMLPMSPCDENASCREILLVVLSVNLMMVLTLMRLLLTMSMNVQHLIEENINVVDSPHVLIPLAHMTLNVMLVSKVMVSDVVIFMSASLRSIIVHLMLDVTTRWDHIHVNVTVDFLMMAKLVITSSNVPKKISVDQILHALTNLVVTHVTVKLDS